MLIKNYQALIFFVNFFLSIVSVFRDGNCWYASKHTCFYSMTRRGTRWAHSFMKLSLLEIMVKFLPKLILTSEIVSINQTLITLNKVTNFLDVVFRKTSPGPACSNFILYSFSSAHKFFWPLRGPYETDKMRKQLMTHPLHTLTLLHNGNN